MNSVFGKSVLVLPVPELQERSMVRVHMPVTSASPPKVSLYEAIKAWSVMVLAVCCHAKIAPGDLTKRTGRPSRREAQAKKLLCAAFLEVSDSDGELVISWLEQCLQLGRRSIVDGLREEQEPAGLAEVLQLYTRLMREAGPDEIRELAATGLFGERRSRGTVWPKGLLEKLGLA